jgi:hypothetical protein
MYLRASSIQRVVRHESAEPALQVGQEHGLAVRILDRKSGRIGFAATSGSGNESFSWALAAARAELAAAGEPEPEGPESWPVADSQERMDRDPVSEPATPESMRAWTDEAIDLLEQRGAKRTAPFRPGKAWVEVSSTVEMWLAGDGLQAERGRNRAWAVVHPQAGRSGGASPLTVAVRRWSELGTAAWSDLADDRVWPVKQPADPGDDETPVLFGPEASGALVNALVRAVHAPGTPPGDPVGPGWNVVEDPLERGTLFGSTFDDCCFPSRTRLLADGKRVVRATGGQGGYRRPSFRDPPVQMPGPLLQRGPEVDLPRDGVLAASLSLHALGSDDWILEISGGRLVGDAPGPRIPSAFIRISPRELLRRCLGTFGAPRSTHNGVHTPALLFAPLPIQLL